MKIWALVDASGAVQSITLSTDETNFPSAPDGLEVVEAPAGTALIVKQYDRATKTFR